jgi:alkylhydroperoxidase/carboxymuconolactone decarboxylase family protein YurZ
MDMTGRPAIEDFQPRSFDEAQARFTRLDPSFARLWSAHVSYLLSRPQLDQRTRLLILVGQYTLTGRTPQLEEAIEVALGKGIEPQDVLEVILQCYVYTGQWQVIAATEVFERVLAASPGGAQAVASPTEAQPQRDLDAERSSWSPTDRDDPRLERFLDRYGWQGISTGLRLRPGHHINLVDTLDALDPGFLQNWLDSVYLGMYSRKRLDDRTRILCVVGDTLAVGEGHQSRRHMRSALHAGATPRELLEVIFQTTAIFGHPYLIPMALDDLVLLADDEGRLAELVDADRIDGIRRIAQARTSRRGGVQEIGTVV